MKPEVNSPLPTASTQGDSPAVHAVPDIQFNQQQVKQRFSILNTVHPSDAVKQDIRSFVESIYLMNIDQAINCIPRIPLVFLTAIRDRSLPLIMGISTIQDLRLHAALIRHGVSVNTTHGTQAFSVLMWAVHVNNIKLVKLLLENGANLDYKDTRGQTAEFVAMQSKNQPIIDLLKEHRVALLKNDNVTGNHSHPTNHSTGSFDQMTATQLLLYFNKRISQDDEQAPDAKKARMDFLKNGSC